MMLNNARKYANLLSDLLGKTTRIALNGYGFEQKKINIQKIQKQNRNIRYR